MGRAEAAQNEGETQMSYRKLTGFAAAAALAFAIGAAGTPAHAILSVNAITSNALTPRGSSLDELNGVAVEGMVLAQVDGGLSVMDEGVGVVAAPQAFDQPLEYDW
jgi:hypothetical protein